MAALRQVALEDMKWIFPGRNPLSGTKSGIGEVIAFFDTMGGIIGSSNPRVEKLVTGVNDDYVVECQHIVTNRKDGKNLDHHWCVLWTIRDGNIVEGRHFAGDQHKADVFFSSVIGNEDAE